MARKLSNLTWQDVAKEMSIAGDPKKITAIGEDVRLLIARRIDFTNISELDNVEFMLKVVIASFKMDRKEQYKRQHP